MKEVSKRKGRGGASQKGTKELHCAIYTHLNKTSRKLFDIFFIPTVQRNVQCELQKEKKIIFLHLDHI